MHCQVTLFEVREAPRHPDLPVVRWMAVASSHSMGAPNAAGRTPQCRGIADNDAGAVLAALSGLVTELSSFGERVDAGRRAVAVPTSSERARALSRAASRALPASFTCEVSAWEIEGTYRAVATTHVFDPAFAPPPLTVETALLVGAVMRVFTAEASEQLVPRAGHGTRDSSVDGDAERRGAAMTFCS